MKKKYLFLFSVLLIIASCNLKDKQRQPDVMNELTAAQKAKMDEFKKDTTSVKVLDSIYNFGKRMEGDIVEHKFLFVNTGKNPLVFPETPITSCGCTVSERPTLPVMPGDTSFIKAVFNSKGKYDQITKKITVISNAYYFPQLVITGYVEKTE